MKILVTGVKGQLGHDVVAKLNTLGIENHGVDIDEFDLTSEKQTCDYILAYKPDAVIHCAAYTAVDKAEDEPILCHAINVNGTMYIAEVCRKLDAKMLYISTDYVFGGYGERPFETGDKKDPQNQYGISKSLGEDAVMETLKKYFILRTSWVFGLNGNNFVKTMLRLGAEKDELKVVADQIGSPTYTYHLADLICDMVVTDRYGVYHASNEGFCSWYEFACEIMNCSGRKAKVLPCSTDEYPVKAKRPLNSRLSNESLEKGGFKRLPSWQDALKHYLKMLNEC